MTAWYNDNDPLKAEVLRCAIEAGAIAPGVVDERSIAEIEPADLVGYAQCHFFAGGGFWSLALRYAGWPDDRPAWTGSCPCPSFSAAGKGRGFDDARHLWPDWYRLIRQRRPGAIFGEQVAAAIGHGWLDVVSGDLEAEGYAVAAAVLGAHSVGAPHIRQRLYFCADAASERHDRRRTGKASNGVEATQRIGGKRELKRLRDVGLSANPECDGGRPDIPKREAEGRTVDGRDCPAGNSGDAAQRGLPMRGSAPGNAGHAPLADATGGGADTEHGGREGRHALRSRPNTALPHGENIRPWRGPGWLDPLTARSVAEAGATRGFWGDCDWWYGRDDKFRPIGPGLFPLAHGSPARVGRLRLYGDGIVIPAAQAFIESAMEVLQ